MQTQKHTHTCHTSSTGLHFYTQSNQKYQKCQTLMILSNLSPRVYTYNIEIWFKRTDVGMNASTHKISWESLKGLYCWKLFPCKFAKKQTWVKNAGKQNQYLTGRCWVQVINPLECKDNYRVSNQITWSWYTGSCGLLHLVQREWDWTGWGPAQSPPCCTKCNSPHINGQCTNHHTAV